jgi:hypothetical protein
MLRELIRFALALVAMLPWELVALKTGVAPDLPHVRVQLGLSWLLAVTGWIPVLWLVEPRISTLRPALLAACAIALGVLAGGIPGVVLLVLLAWTAPEGSLEASAAAVRARWKPVALAAVGTVVVMLAIPLVMMNVLVHPLPLKPKPVNLAEARAVVRATVVALVVVAPVSATVLARLRSR